MTFEEAKAQFEELFAHRMDEAQMRDFLIANRPDAHTSTEFIAAAASVMRAHAIRLHVSADLQPRLIDVVGTGGDKSGSFNISSTVAILLSACGAFVAKHGSRSVTSKSGSADALEALGIRLDLSLDATSRMLEETGFCFMFAQNHHPAMKFIMPVRKSIPDKTIFNVLGPLTNPAGVRKILLGVFEPALVRQLAEALRINGATSAMVVSARDRLDEISISDTTFAAELSAEGIREFEIDPALYGIRRAPFEAIKGGDAQENAQIIHAVLEGCATDAQRDVVLINAAHALKVEGMARDVQEGLEIARDVIASGAARRKLAQIIDVSTKL
ncbi:MAG: anthranilate phosphoribosyltransferase [Campylobacterales bacterium]|nr:anthranilate phosphoribosyltransferase [Campylobacterales bacterium]